MTNSPKVITEARLRTSINELAHAAVLEMSMACRKLSIYSSGHPLGLAAIEKPYLVLNRIFSFRKYINIHTLRGQLYVCNIALKESVFTTQILQYMQILDLTALLFERSMTLGDFTHFMERFVRRMRQEDPEYLMMDYLSHRGVTSVEVNSETAFRIFETQRQYRGDVDDDFSVKRLVLDALGTDPVPLAKFNEADEGSLLELGIDFDRPIVKYLIPERVTSIPYASIRAALEQLATSINTGGTERTDYKANVDQYMSLFKLVELHPDREKIIANLDDASIRSSARPRKQVSDDTSRTGAIKVSTLSRMDAVLDELFCPSHSHYDINEFCDAFRRLLKTGQRAKAEEVTLHLLGLLRDANPSFRQKALGLLAASIDELNLLTDAAILETAIATMVDHLAHKRETYEYSELIWKLSQKSLAEKRYDWLARIAAAMAARRHFDREVTVYDSMAVKKAFEMLNRSDVIERLINELIAGEHDKAGAIKQILVAIGSEEVALALSQIIAHPVRQVRQQSLKVLAELGKASLKIFSRIIVDDSWFERDAERFELPDAKWYTIRNSIFVLGSLKDPEGVIPLRLRISDHDIRVRREIVSALEKIGGDEAVDLLVLMAEDEAREIRESAISAVGVIGSADTVPLLIDVARRNSSEAIRAVSVMGKLGGPEAKNYLSQLLEDENALTTLSAGKVSKEDLRVAVVKALGAMGSEAIEKIRKYQASLSAAQKLFFKNSPVNRAIAEVLNRK
ncbi:MAG: HEAT repeat domain-containing protein [Candidatus Zixiibacteriota bacterium]